MAATLSRPDSPLRVKKSDEQTLDSPPEPMARNGDVNPLRYDWNVVGSGKSAFSAKARKPDLQTDAKLEGSVR